MSSHKCCVPGCDNGEGPHRVLHVFPNPAKDWERFNTWVLSIGGDIVGLSNDFIHKYRRVCHAHFEEKFCCRLNRLSNIAVPTLKLPGSLSIPKFTLEQRRNVQVNLPPASKGFSLEMFPPEAQGENMLIENIENPLNKEQDYQDHVPSMSKGVPPETKNVSTPLKEIQNLLEVYPSTSKDPIVNMQKSPGKGDMACAQKINRSFKKTSDITVAKPFRMKAKTQTEQNLYRKLIKLRVKLSKYRNKVKKQAASIKASKKIISNPEFLRILEDMPSSARILTLMQFRENKKKNKGRRFSLEDKLVSLAIFKQSPKAYRLLRRMLILPAPQTLAKLIQKANLAPGINKKVFTQLKKSAEGLKQQDRLCVLMFDEMSLAANVSYNERKDRITGFVSNGRETKPDYADHAQVFMLRGLLKNYKQPLSYTFAAAATKGPELCRQIKEIVQEIQKTGFIIVATVCDQGTNNRQAIKLLVTETHENCLRAGQEPKENIILINDQEIVPLYDAPHMLKCVRNNLLTKNLEYNLKGETKTAKWDHLELLLKENPGYRGLRLIPKLTDYHIVQKKVPKMKVKYASQVFSQTVAKTMGFLADKELLPVECKETADLLLFFDELFDSVNGSFGKKSHAKPLLGAVTPKSIHHKVWNEAKQVLTSMKFVNKTTGKTESVPTLRNWAWTLDNIEILLKKLKSKYDISSVWMRHLNQDPIENFFGAIRSHGCRNINPTPEKFESAITTLLLNNMSSVHAVGGNCEKDKCLNLYALLITDCDEPKTTCEINEIPDIEIKPISEKNDPRIFGTLQYVSGYFIKQGQKKIFKGCKTCKKELKCDTPTEYLKYREYAGGRWLVTPTTELVLVVSNLQDICFTILQNKLEQNLLKEFLKTIIFIFIDFKFITCTEHKEKLIEFLINLSCRFFIHNRCKDLNKILSGKRDCENYDDIYAIKAKKLFTKYKKKTEK